MLTINYDSKNGESYRDGEVEKIAKRYGALTSRPHDVSLTTSSALLILAFRVLVCEGEIPYDKIQFKFGDKILKIDKDGRFPNVPPVDIHMDLLMRLL